MLQEPRIAKVRPTANILLTNAIDASFTCVAACKTPTIKPATKAANNAGPEIKQVSKIALRNSSTAPSVVTAHPLARARESRKAGRREGARPRVLLFERASWGHHAGRVGEGGLRAGDSANPKTFSRNLPAFPPSCSLVRESCVAPEY